MNRIVVIVVLVSSLVLVQASRFGIARQEQPTQQEASKAGELPPAAWETVEPGLKVLKLWKTSAGPRWPEIAVLQTSAKLHRQLNQDPLEFLRKYKIFDKVDKVKGRSFFRLIEGKRSTDPDGSYVTVILHSPQTYAAITSFEVGAIQER